MAARLPTTTKGPITGLDWKQEAQDVASINNDLALLSSLLGRSVSIADLPELNKAFGIPSRSKPIPTSVVPAKESPLQNEVIDAVSPGNDKTRVKSEIDTGSPKIKPESLDSYGKTDDALLATILKQNGIGPSNNNIPVQLLLHQVMGAASTPFSRSTDTTTQRPASATPGRRPRPIIDGLAWLWRTWQETDPRKSKRPNSDLSAVGPNGEFSAEEYTNDGSGVS